MVKAEKHIERDLYSLIKQSDFAKIIRGNIYRKDMRPDGTVGESKSKSLRIKNSKIENSGIGEDVVVKFLSGVDGQVQQGVVVVNIYVNDIVSAYKSGWVEDTQRVEELEDAFIKFIQNCRSSEYDYSMNAAPVSYEVEGIKQHVIAARVNYKRITEDRGIVYGSER